MYKTLEETVQKLVKTVVTYKNKAVIIENAQSVGSDIQLYIGFLPVPSRPSSDCFQWKSISDPDFDFRNIGRKLGYINYAYQKFREAVYAYRLPVRKSQQTQGLSIHNTYITRFNGSPDFNVATHNPDFNKLTHDQCLANTIEGVYPSVKEIGAKFNKDEMVKSLAFSRRYSIKKNRIGPFYLEHMGEDVGWSDDLAKFKIGQDYIHLKEELQDMEGLQVV